MPSGATRAIFWSFLFSPILILAHTLVSGALARVLSPADYGFFAAANSLVTLVAQLSQRGVVMSITRQRQLHPEDIGDSYVVSIVIACLLALCLYAIAPFVVGSRIEAEIARFMILPLCITLLTAPAAGLLQRNMLVFQMNIVSICALVIGGGAVTIAFALAGFGCWSLPYGAAFNALLTGIGTLWFTRTPVKIRYAPERWRRLLASAFSVSGLRTIDTCWVQGPILIAARIAAVDDVGVFQRVHYLALMIYQSTIWNGIAVLYPIIATNAEDEPSLRRHFVEFFRFYFYLAIVLSVFAWVSAYDIILVLFGSKWTVGTAFFRILLCGAASYTLNQMAVSYQEARGKYGHRYVAAFASFGTMLAMAAVTYGEGLDSLAWSFSFSAAVMLVVGVIFVALWLRLSLGDVFRAVAPGLGVAPLLYGLLIGSNTVLEPILSPGVPTLFARGLEVGLALAFSIRFSIPELLREPINHKMELYLGRYSVLPIMIIGSAK